MIPVLYLHHRAEVSGGETSLLVLWERLDRREFIPILAGVGEGAFADRARQTGIEVHPVSFPRMRGILGSASIRTIRRLRTVIRQTGARIVHGNAPVTNLIAALAGRLAGCRVIWHERTLLRPLERDLDRALRILPDRIICNSAAVARRFPGSGKAVVIRNGVDLTRFHPKAGGASLRLELGVTPDEVLVGIVGNFSPSKRHEVFIEAAAEARCRVPTLRFWVVGSEVFPENRGREPTLRRLASQRGLDDRLAFVGERPDMAAIMDALDVLAAPATAEACSRAVLEAMACGTPVVGAAAGGTPELVADGQTGVLVPPDDAGAIADALVQFALCPSLRQTMGKAARHRAQAEFALERQVVEIETVYRALAFP